MSLNKIRASLDRLLDKRKTNNTITKWQIINGALLQIVDHVERSSYYPTIYQKEGIAELLKRCLLDIDGQKND